MQTILLAGGRGSRLNPFTKILPKPLIPIKDQPIAGILIQQLKESGTDEIVMCLGYLADLLKAYFGDGSNLGLTIRYSIESEPLGTAGPLRKVQGLRDNFLVVNGDELTTLDFGRLYSHHMALEADLTVAVQMKTTQSSFGVLEVKDGKIISYQEKPTHNYWASMGIYAVNKRILSLIPEDKPFDMPELVQLLLERGGNVVSYESRDLWFDIGTFTDLEKAKEQWEK